MKTIEMLMTSEAAADDTSLHAYNSANASCSSVLLFFWHSLCTYQVTMRSPISRCSTSTHVTLELPILFEQSV